MSPPPSPSLPNPLRVTRSHHLPSRQASLASTSNGATPLLSSNAHNVIPSLSFQPSSPVELRKPSIPTSAHVRSYSTPTTTAPKIRARVTPNATPRRKVALPGTEYADIPVQRASVAHSQIKRPPLSPAPLPLPRATPFSFREMDDEMEGLGRGLAGLGLAPTSGSGSGMMMPRDPFREERRTQGGKDNVLVCVRVRPPAAKLAQATLATNDIAWDVIPETGTVALSNQPATEYVFDSIVTGSDNEGVYAAAGKDLVIAAMEGFDAVIFAYGQTASGKTFTLSGNAANPGVIPQAVSEIFQFIKEYPERTYLLRASYLEIYNETLKDLLAPESGPLKIRQDEKKRFFVHPLREEVVTGEAQVAALLKRGEENRHTGRTDFNERSSRSHSVFQITIESRDNDDDGSAPPPSRYAAKSPYGPRLTPGSNGIVRMSRLSLIDLAGSEQATSQTERRSEGAFINKRPHVPYRDSKLTQILQPSLAGDARVAVIATMNPSPSAVEETKSTLKFAQRVKKVVLKAQVNEVVGDKALIHKYQSTIMDLEAQLAIAIAAASASVPSTPSLSEPRVRTKVDQPEIDKINANISQLKSLFLTSNNVEDRRKSLLPPRPVSPMKMRRSSEADIAEDGSGVTFEEKYLDSRDEVLLLKEENEELRQRISDLEEAALAAPVTEGERDGRLKELIRENRELRVLALNPNEEAEIKLQQRRYDRMLAQRDEYANSVRESLVKEREKSKSFERFVLQHLLSQAASLTDRRRSSIGHNFGAELGGFPALMSESPELDSVSPEYVGLDVVDLQDLQFSAEAKAQITRSGSTLFAPFH
ncbi:hypothetical protein P7C70_g8423, partial [Phenoliferia sp. Uapishka_3]